MACAPKTPLPRRPHWSSSSTWPARRATTTTSIPRTPWKRRGSWRRTRWRCCGPGCKPSMGSPASRDARRPSSSAGSPATAGRAAAGAGSARRRPRWPACWRGCCGLPTPGPGSPTATWTPSTATPARFWDSTGYERDRRTVDLTQWHGLLLERLIGSETEDRLDRLAHHPALGGPELEFLQAQLAYQRGDVSSARGLVQAALQRLPGHQDFLDFASEIGAPLPPRAQQIIEERSPSAGSLPPRASNRLASP